VGVVGAAIGILAILSYLLLNGLSLWRRGQTLGKRVMGIAIHKLTTGDSSDCAMAPLWKLVCVRALFFPLLFLLPMAVLLSPIALLPIIDQLMIFTKNRRCLHDYASGTMVVRLIE